MNGVADRMYSGENVVKDRAIDEHKEKGDDYIALLYSFPAEDGSNRVVNHIVPQSFVSGNICIPWGVRWNGRSEGFREAGV